jgi:predicted ATPase/DNA-binding SARP family transcriptional activator
VTGAADIVGVRILGQVALLRGDGEIVAVPSATQRRLLVMLALQRGRAVRPERLGDDLRLTPGALRKAVSRLRALVGEGALRTGTVGYVLELDVDAEAFADAVRRAPTAPDRLATLHDALALWPGDALDEFATEPWARGEATRLDELRGGAVEELAALLLAAGRVAEAVAELERHVVRRPFADRPRLLLMCALAADGRRTEALRSYQSYRSHLAEAVGTEPSAELRDAERRIARGWDGRPSGIDEGAARRTTSGPTRPARGAALPVPATRWVGPTDTIDATADLVALERVVTLVGPGGVGKTRSATEVASAVEGRFADGVCFVELGAVGDPAQVADAIATSVGSTRQAGLSVLASLVDRLRGRHLLLVLDNCEHVSGAASEVVAAVGVGCPTVTVLATSREPLRVGGEHVVPVPALAHGDGVELFADRVRAADATRRLSDDDRVTIARICEQLDGIPLALELAAARTRTLALPDLLARLSDRLDLFGGGGRGLDHQRTLRATVDWSYELLDEDERLLFERLSVFAGSFDHAAAVDVCGTAPLSRRGVATGLTALVERSMVVIDHGPGGGRYRLLETLRAHSEERLARRRQTAAVGFRHLEHFVALAEQAAETWFSPGQLDADAVFDREWDNLRAAHTFADATRHVRQAERLLVATVAHSQLRMRTEHGSWCQATVDAAGPDAVPPSVAGWAAWWSMVAGEHERSEALCRAAIVAATASAPPGTDPADVGLALCRSVAAFTAWSAGRRAEAAADVAALEAVIDRLPPWPAYTAVRALFSFSAGDQWEARAARIAAICEGIGAPSLVASARFYQATAKLYAGPTPDAATAAGLHEDGIALAHSAGAGLSEGQHLQGLLDAKVALDAGDAAEVCVRALVRLRDLGYWLYQWRVLDSAAFLLAGAGRADEAATVLGHLDAHAPPWRSQPRGATRALLADHAGTESRGRAGAALDREEVVVLAVTAVSEVAAAPVPAGAA